MKQTDGRSAVMRALHAEGVKQGLDPEAVTELTGARFSVGSLSELDATKLGELFQQITGRSRRKAAGTEGRKDSASKVATLVDPGDCEVLYRLAYGNLGWTDTTLRRFIARQLKGREQIVTMGDLNKVLWAVKSMVRKLESKQKGPV